MHLQPKKNCHAAYYTARTVGFHAYMDPDSRRIMVSINFDAGHKTSSIVYYTALRTCMRYGGAIHSLHSCSISKSQHRLICCTVWQTAFCVCVCVCQACVRAPCYAFHERGICLFVQQTPNIISFSWKMADVIELQRVTGGKVGPFNGDACMFCCP